MSARRNRHYDKSVYRSIAMVTQFGLNMLVPICLMSALGIYLDGQLGTSYWMIILFFVGAIAGGQNVYRMAKQIYTPAEEKEEASESSMSKESSHENNR